MSILIAIIILSSSGATWHLRGWWMARRAASEAAAKIVSAIPRERVPIVHVDFPSNRQAPLPGVVWQSDPYPSVTLSTWFVYIGAIDERQAVRLLLHSLAQSPPVAR